MATGNDNVAIAASKTQKAFEVIVQFVHRGDAVKIQIAKIEQIMAELENSLRGVSNTVRSAGKPLVDTFAEVINGVRDIQNGIKQPRSLVTYINTLGYKQIEDLIATLKQADTGIFVPSRDTWTSNMYTRSIGALSSDMKTALDQIKDVCNDILYEESDGLESINPRWKRSLTSAANVLARDRDEFQMLVDIVRQIVNWTSETNDDIFAMAREALEYINASLGEE